MELVTWNLNGLDEVCLDERTEAALFTILLGGDPGAVLLGEVPRRDPPDVVVLQEVVERTFTAHVAPHLRAAGYALIPAEPPARGYFEVVGVRGMAVRRAESLPFPRTGQGRRLVRVELGSGLTVFTAHLESLRPGAPVRVEQAAFVLRMMREGPSVFAGDTNLRDGEWSGLDHAGVDDVWEALGRDPATRATWSRMRFDRVWVSGGVRGVRFERIGTKPMPSTGTTPSDHVGLRVGLEVPALRGA